MVDFNDYSGLQLWIEADTITGLSDGDPLVADPADGDPGGNVPPFATWPDAGPVENYSDDIYSTSDPDTTPTWHTNVLCSKPVVRFVSPHGSAGDELTSFNRRTRPQFGPHSSLTSSSTGFTTFQLFRINDLTTTTDEIKLWGLPESGGLVGLSFSLRDAAGTGPGTIPTLTLAVQTNVAVYRRTMQVTVGLWYLVESSWDGSTLSLRVNAGTPLTIATSGTITSVASFSYMGDSSPGAQWEFDLVGSVIYDEAKTSSDLTDIRGIWYSKYFCLCQDPPDSIADLTLWVEAGVNQAGLLNGDPVTPWNEAGPVGTTSYSDLQDGGDISATAPHYSTTDGPCSTPVIHFAEALSGATEGLSTEYTGGRQLSPGSSNFDPANSVFAMAAGTYMTLFRVPTLPASSDPAAFLVLDGDRNATIVVANSDYATDFLGLTDDPGDPGNQCDRAIPKLADGVVRVDVLIDDYVASPDFDVRTNDVFRIASFPYVAGQWVLIWFRLGGGAIHIERAGVVGYDFAQDGGFGPQPQFQMSFINGRIAYGTDIKLAFGYRRSLTNGEITALISSYITCGYPCLDFSGGGSACVPTSGLTLYLDSTRVGVLSDGDSIALWPEAGPIANVYPNDMVAGVGFKPTVKALYGGCKVVRFEEDGITHRRMATRTRRFDDAGVDPTIELLSETGFTIIAMGRALGTPTSVSGYEFDFLFDYDSGGNAYIEGGLFNYATSGTVAGGDFVTAGVHPLFYLYNDDNSPVAEWAWNIPVLPEEWILLVVRWDGTTIRGTINRANEKTNAVSTFSATFPLGWVTGFNDFNSLNVGNRGDIGFLLSYNRYLDNTELNTLLDCLEAQCLGPGGGSGSGVRVRNTQFIRVGAGAGL